MCARNSVGGSPFIFTKARTCNRDLEEAGKAGVRHRKVPMVVGLRGAERSAGKQRPAPAPRGLQSVAAAQSLVKVAELITAGGTPGIGKEGVEWAWERGGDVQWLRERREDLEFRALFCRWVRIWGDGERREWKKERICVFRLPYTHFTNKETCMQRDEATYSRP